MHSTRSALANGASEANPLMKAAAGSDTTMIAMKAAGTAATIWAAERLWKKNRKAAVITTILVNVASAAVVFHNYRITDR